MDFQVNNKLECYHISNENTESEDENSFYTEYRTESNGKMYLAKASNSYLRLKGYGQNAVGEAVDNLKLERITDEMKFYPENKEHYFNVLKEIKYENKNTLWKICVKGENSSIKISGEKIFDFDINTSYANRYFYENSILSSEFSGMVVVSLKDGQLITETYAGSAKEFFPEIKTGVPLNNSLKGKEGFGKLETVINRCIKENIPIHYYDSCKMADGAARIIYLSIKPISNNSSISAIIYLRQIDGSENLPVEKYNNFNFVNKYIVGFGMIDCSMPENIYFFDINPFLLHLAANDAISFDSLIKSEPVSTAVLKMTSCCGSYIYGNKYNMNIPYIVSVVPNIKNNKAVGAILTVIPAKNTGEICTDGFKALTNRESEVANIAAKGYTNRYIAHNLNISEGTVKKILYNCYRKLGVNSRIEMVKMLFRRDDS